MMLRKLVLVCLCLLCLPSIAAGGEVAPCADGTATKPAGPRRGFYLHGCWKYNHPFAVRSWKRADYHSMFRLLEQLGFNTVMLWPTPEAIPPPLSEVDREAVHAFRPIIDDAQNCGLETWLVYCVVASHPEIAERPWLERSLYAHKKMVRMDDPQEAEAYLQHRASILRILNNADGYVTIDGDPGGYAGAKPSDLMKVFLSDRETIDRFGTHPKTQKVIPWIWCGWGTKGVWQEPIAPFVSATLDAIKQQQAALEPWELLPGRSYRDGHANGRINMELTKKAGLLDRSTLFCYEIIEFEPSVPRAVLQFDHIRRVLQQELAESPGARGFFGNAQTPIMAIPDLFLFARGLEDPSYLDQPDERVLGDLARFLGGPPELLVPAWACLRLPLDQLPVDLPQKLRAAKLTSPAAALLPGRPDRYLAILAAQVDSRIRLLKVHERSAETPQEVAAAIADGTAALVDWWNVHRYVGSGEGNEPFGWKYAPGYRLLRAWCAKHVTDPGQTAALAVKEITRRSILTEPMARDRVSELLRR